MIDDHMTVEKYERDGFVGEVRLEDGMDSELYNPRKEQENLSTMVVEHSRYILGDGTMAEILGYGPDDFDTTNHYEQSNHNRMDKIERYIRMKYKAAAFTWLGLLDHSGLHMYAGGESHWSDYGGWDSGTVGFAFVSQESIEKMGAPPESARRQMMNEIEEYDSYLRGEIYAIIITDRHGEVVESVGGFVGDHEYVAEEMRGLVDDLAKESRHQKWESISIDPHSPDYGIPALA